MGWGEALRKRSRGTHILGGGPDLTGGRGSKAGLSPGTTALDTLWVGAWPGRCPHPTPTRPAALGVQRGLFFFFKLKEKKK